MPTNLIRPANSWSVAVQGESNWRCRIKHKWHYLKEDKLRACERCGQMMGRRDYLNWIVGPSKSNINPRPRTANPLPAPSPKRRPWDAYNRQPSESVMMKALREGVEISQRNSYNGHIYNLDVWRRPERGGPRAPSP